MTILVYIFTTLFCIVGLISLFMLMRSPVPVALKVPLALGYLVGIGVAVSAARWVSLAERTGARWPLVGSPRPADAQLARARLWGRTFVACLCLFAIVLAAFVITQAIRAGR